MKPPPTRRIAVETPALLSFRGPDAVRYLNGQITQDVASLGNLALPACVTDAKGRLQFMISVFRGPADDEIRIAGDPARSGELLARLERYLIADEVEIDDLGGGWERVHAEAPLEGASLTREAAGPFGPGIDHWFPAGAAPQGGGLDPDEVETLRITAGIPVWGRELHEGILPPEAGLDRTAISYSKGCYIGQEVISRIKSVGRVNRRLARLSTAPTEHPVPAPLLADGAEAGQLTSLAPIPGPDGFHAALGYIGKKAYDRECFHLPGDTPVRFLGWA